MAPEPNKSASVAATASRPSTRSPPKPSCSTIGVALRKSADIIAMEFPSWMTPQSSSPTPASNPLQPVLLNVEANQGTSASGFSGFLCFLAMLRRFPLPSQAWGLASSQYHHGPLVHIKFCARFVIAVRQRKKWPAEIVHGRRYKPQHRPPQASRSRVAVTAFVRIQSKSDPFLVANVHGCELHRHRPCQRRSSRVPLRADPRWRAAGLSSSEWRGIRTRGLLQGPLTQGYGSELC